MPRWGDNSAKGTNQKTQARYVAGATAVGAGVAGAGALTAQSGKRLATRSSAKEYRAENLRRMERGHSESLARAQQSPIHISNQRVAQLDRMVNRPSGQRVNSAAKKLHEIAPDADSKTRGAAKGRLTSALRNPQFANDVQDAKIAGASLRHEQESLRGLQARYATSTKTQRALSRTRDAAAQAKKVGAARHIRGRRMVMGAAAIPLAAMATAHKVGRTWAPTSRPEKKGAPLKEVKHNAYVAKPDKPVKLTPHQQSLLDNSSNIQEKGWSLTAAEKRHQRNRAMQKPEGGWR